ncbi:MAG: hypothetical protein V3T14_11455, partial [Myxococcota bacterium]
DRLMGAAELLSDAPLVFSHSVYQYLERRYGLNGRSVHWEPDEMPEDASWSALEALLEEHPAKGMIWEGEPLPETELRLQSLGVQSVLFLPCGNMPEPDDWLNTMRENAARLELFAGTLQGHLKARSP